MDKLTQTFVIFFEDGLWFPWNCHCFPSQQLTVWMLAPSLCQGNPALLFSDSILIKTGKKKHCFLKGHVKQDKDREIGSHFLKLMKVSLSAMQHKGRTIHYFMAILRKCWAHSLCSVEQPAQQSRLNNLTFISTCWISLYICFDRKAGNSLFHGQ